MEVGTKIPCSGCKEYYVGCKRHCVKYGEFKMELNDIREQVRKILNKERKENS